ncbi:TonB-dependent siderophore receptor [Pseudoalteromonas citrea]|uniref:TonB-dependent siderophore receptor n=1 Tax=Pseudoalteromonas citrea TaxID=43655 RepID=A0A5S3XUC4_9GAMM|nr:TonB-dependent siderophore receptor [Pseudoalteromonas citrea]TMP42201.1 TonB-dependent siderophore receptor [Pseudoalteromonas citrea]TMP62329.1 TonB-dependent siderophore receptor [Pseudoalteromonas citrea]
MKKLKLKYPKLLAASLIALSGNTLADDIKQDDIEKITVSPTGLISYVSASASKSDTPIIESPVSVSVLTSERIQALGAENLQEAIGYVAGVFNGPYGVDTRGDWANIRGVAPVQYLDGLQLMFGYYNNARPNTYNMERIEILKGPSSMLYGQGSTGGIINIVTKRPHAQTEGEIIAQVGNFGRKQIAGDFNTTLTDNGSVEARFVGLYRESGTQTDFVDNDATFFAPSLAWHINDSTSITVLANIQKNKSGSSTQFFPHEGTLLPAEHGQIDSRRFVSEPGWDKYDTEQNAVTLILDHALNEDFSISWSSRYLESEAIYRTMYAWPPKFQDDKRSIERNFSLQDASSDTITSDLQLHGLIYTGDLEHKLVVGLDYQNADTDTDRLYLTPASIKAAIGLDVNTSLDLYNPEYGKTGFLPTTALIPDTPGKNDRQLGFYIQDTIKYDNWVFNAALRRDKVKSQSDAVNSVKTTQSATTGRLGILYSFENGIAPYASYSESFLPIYGSRPQGGDFKPQEGEQVEVGVKFQPQGTEHLITASYFDITDKNKKRVVSPEVTVQDGSVDIEGFEVEAQLEFDQFDVYSAYAYTKSEQETSDKTLAELVQLYASGQTSYLSQALTDTAPLSATPKHMLNTWITYRPEQSFEGFKVGAGFRYVGETYDGSRDITFMGQAINTRKVTDSYTLFDFMIGYEFDNIDINLNVKNLSDKTVVTSCLYRGDCFYGQRRTVTANIKYKF